MLLLAQGSQAYDVYVTCLGAALAKLLGHVITSCLLLADMLIAAVLNWTVNGVTHQGTCRRSGGPGDASMEGEAFTAVRVVRLS